MPESRTTNMGTLPTASRILLIHSADEAYGSDRVLLNIATCLRLEGCDIRVVLPDDAPEGWLSAQLSKLNVTVHRGPLAVARRRYFNRSALLKYLFSLRRAQNFLKEEIRDFDPEVVHVNSSGLIIAALLGSRRTWSLIWHVHEIIEQPRHLAWFFRKLPLSADRIVVVSQAVFDHLSTARSFAGKASVVRNGISSRELPEKPPAPPMRVCFAGRLSEWKGYQIFLDAAIALASQDLDLQFIIAGDPLPDETWRIADIKSAIEHSGVSDRISYVGFQEDVPNLFDTVHMVAVTSILPDPLPTVVLEAMRSGCAVVATRHGGAVEMIVEHVCGELVDPGDSEALQRAILSLSRRPEIVAAMGSAGWARIESEFTTEVFWNNMSVEFARALDIAAKRRSGVASTNAARNDRVITSHSPGK